MLPLLLSLSWYIVGRVSFTSVVQSDGTVLVMGGQDAAGNRNDVWKSNDRGASWIAMSTNAGWTGSVA